MPTAPTVFISYSHKDEVWKDRLLDHLGSLEEEGLLKVWNDRNIGAGDEWFEEIRSTMDAAQVAPAARRLTVLRSVPGASFQLELSHWAID